MGACHDVVGAGRDVENAHDRQIQTLRPAEEDFVEREHGRFHPPEAQELQLCFGVRHFDELQAGRFAGGGVDIEAQRLVARPEMVGDAQGRFGRTAADPSGGECPRTEGAEPAATGAVEGQFHEQTPASSRLFPVGGKATWFLPSRVARYMASSTRARLSSKGASGSSGATPIETVPLMTFP